MPRQVNNRPELKQIRRELRHNLTPAEATLWRCLQNKQLAGRKFRRQHSVGSYVLDFYCPSEMLAIELDGAGQSPLPVMNPM
jgi:very-short-patch-repair endonuclease